MKQLIIRLFLLLSCVVALGVLGGHFSKMIDELPHTTRQCLKTPVQCDGVEFGVSVYVVESIEGLENYTVSRSGLKIPVMGSSEGLKEGQRISVKGRFQASPPGLIAEYKIVHRFRLVKEIFGIVALIVIFTIVYREWSITKEGISSRA
jgi:hypothetical protein